MKKGFTLIELLIVISIISIIIGLGSIYYKAAQDKAKNVQVLGNIASIKHTFEQARVLQTKVLGNITENWCTECYCRTDPSSQTCKDTVSAAWSKVSSNPMLYDPWGRPYMWDENEDEPGYGPCRIDIIRSVGPDGTYATGDDTVVNLHTYYCDN